MRSVDGPEQRAVPMWVGHAGGAGAAGVQVRTLVICRFNFVICRSNFEI